MLHFYFPISSFYGFTCFFFAKFYQLCICFNSSNAGVQCFEIWDWAEVWFSLWCIQPSWIWSTNEPKGKSLLNIFQFIMWLFSQSATWILLIHVLKMITAVSTWFMLFIVLYADWKFSTPFFFHSNICQLTGVTRSPLKTLAYFASISLVSVV